MKRLKKWESRTQRMCSGRTCDWKEIQDGALDMWWKVEEQEIADSDREGG